VKHSDLVRACAREQIEREQAVREIAQTLFFGALAVVAVVILIEVIT